MLSVWNNGFLYYPACYDSFTLMLKFLLICSISGSYFLCPTGKSYHSFDCWLNSGWRYSRLSFLSPSSPWSQPHLSVSNDLGSLVQLYPFSEKYNLVLSRVNSLIYTYMHMYINSPLCNQPISFQGCKLPQISWLKATNILSQKSIGFTGLSI